MVYLGMFLVVSDTHGTRITSSATLGWWNFNVDHRAVWTAQDPVQLGQSNLSSSDSFWTTLSWTLSIRCFAIVSRASSINSSTSFLSVVSFLTDAGRYFLSILDSLGGSWEFSSTSRCRKHCTFANPFSILSSRETASDNDSTSCVFWNAFCISRCPSARICSIVSGFFKLDNGVSINFFIRTAVEFSTAISTCNNRKK